MLSKILNFFVKGKYVMFKNKAGQWTFNLKARNNEIVSTGESYSSKQACIKGIKAAKKASMFSVIAEK